MPDVTRRSWRDHPLAQLTLVRFKEFIREPDAVFWTFGFPILLAIGLGIAFRNRPAEVAKVGVVGTTAAADSSAAWIGRARGLQVVRYGFSDSAREALRTGAVALVAEVGDSAGTAAPTYVFDDTRPDARNARLLVDDALQRGAGRADPVPVSERIVRDRGSRYIDFVIPGLLGMNLMAGGIWGLGFVIVDARRKHLLKRLVATPMSRTHYLLSFAFSRLAFLVVEVSVVLGFAVAAFGVPIRGSLAQIGDRGAGGVAHVQRDGPPDRVARTHAGKRVGADERGDDADVGALRNLLLRIELPGRGAAVRAGAAAHRHHRRAPRDHAAGRGLGGSVAGASDPRHLDGRLLHPRAEVVPLALMMHCRP